METSMVSRSIISMSSKPLSARVLSSSHPMPPAPTMRTADRDEGGAGRVSVAGRSRTRPRFARRAPFASLASWRSLTGVVIADVKLERRARAELYRTRSRIHTRETKNVRANITSGTILCFCISGTGIAIGDTKRASRRGYAYARRRGRWRRLPVEPSLQNARLSPRLAFTSASPATALWRSCRT